MSYGTLGPGTARYDRRPPTGAHDRRHGSTALMQSAQRAARYRTHVSFTAHTACSCSFASGQPAPSLGSGSGNR